MDTAQLHDPEEDLRVAIDAHLRNMNVALPVRVMKDSDGKTASLQVTVKAKQTMPDGTVKEVDYPTLDGLVHFPSAGGFSHTFPVKEGDEGMVILASRSIHNWRETGGTQPQVDSRQHDLSDAMFIPGIRAKPRDLKGLSADSAQTRTDDKKSVHDVSHTAVTSVREDAAHQVNGMAVQTQKGGTRQVVDGATIQNVAGKFLVNC